MPHLSRIQTKSSPIATKTLRPAPSALSTVRWYKKAGPITMAETRQIVEAWRREYNESRPHRALGERTPNEFANEIAASRDLIGVQTAENSP